MGLTPGTLTRDRVGFSMPAHAPLFPSPPYEYPGASLLVFTYPTDPETASAMLPEPAGLTDPPVAGLVFADYPASTLGPYREAVQFLECVYEGRAVQYATQLFVTTDVAMAAGRELGGYPKKIAAIDVEGDALGGFRASLARPTGRPLASASLTVSGEPAPLAPGDSTLHYLTLRRIPGPVKGAPPSVSELFLSDWQVRGGRAWGCSGSCIITGSSAADPLHLAPVRGPVSARRVVCDLLVDFTPAEPPPGRPF